MIVNYEYLGRKKLNVLTREGEHVGFVPEIDGFSIPARLVDVTTPGRISVRSDERVRLEYVDIHFENKLYRASIEDFREQGFMYKPARSELYVLPKDKFLTIDLEELDQV